MNAPQASPRGFPVRRMTGDNEPEMFLEQGKSFDNPDSLTKGWHQRWKKHFAFFQNFSGHPPSLRQGPRWCRMFPKVSRHFFAIFGHQRIGLRKGCILPQAGNSLVISAGKTKLAVFQQNFTEEGQFEEGRLSSVGVRIPTMISAPYFHRPCLPNEYIVRGNTAH